MAQSERPLSEAPQRRRGWFQFSLRTLLLAMLALCLALGWFVQRVRRQQEAVSRIVGYGGDVTYDYQLDASGELRRDSSGNYLRGLEPPAPRWLRDLMGDHYFQTPVQVWLGSDEGVGFIDSELAVLAGPLHSLPSLTALDLAGSPITDAGLAHLHGLTQLEQLDLRGTKVTDRGIQSLQQELPRCKITR
jgi:Leucine Rich Repeat (LRR) protein